MGMFFNAFFRHADVVRMANLAQMVNVIAPIMTNEKGLFLQTIYFPIVEYGRQRGNTSLDVWVSSPTYKMENRPQPATAGAADAGKCIRQLAGVFLQHFDQFGRAVLSFCFLGRKFLCHLSSSIEHCNLKTLRFHVKDEVLAHNSEANQPDIALIRVHFSISLVCRHRP